MIHVQWRDGMNLCVGRVPERESYALYTVDHGDVTVLAYFRGEHEAIEAACRLEHLAKQARGMRPSAEWQAQDSRPPEARLLEEIENDTE